MIKIKKILDSQKKQIIATGGTGFVESNIVDKLLCLGHEVIVVDNFFMGQKMNVEHYMHHPYFWYSFIFSLMPFLYHGLPMI